MSYDLSSYDPATGRTFDNGGLGGFSLKKLSIKKVSKAVKKVASPIQKVAGKALPVAALLPIPGIALANKVANTKLAKNVKAVQSKVKATQAVLKAPPKPPPLSLSKPTLTLSPKNRAGSRQGSGASASSVAKAKKVIVKHATNTAAKKVAPNAKIKNGKISTLPVQAHAAGIKFRKRSKKNGGTEIVATDSSGAVVSGPIPEGALSRTGTPVEAGPPLPANSVQNAPPPIPSVEQAQNMIAKAVQDSVPAASDIPSASGGGGSASVPVPDSATPAPMQATPSFVSGLLDNPLAIAGGVAAIGILFLSSHGGRR